VNGWREDYFVNFLTCEEKINNQKSEMQVEQSPPPYFIPYIEFKMKPRDSSSTLFQQHLAKALYSFEKTQIDMGEYYFKKAVEIEPHNYLVYLLRGEMHQFEDNQVAIEYFNKGIECITQYAELQEYPACVKTQEQLTICQKQIRLLFSALILDTQGKTTDAIDTFCDAIGLYTGEFKSSDDFIPEVIQIHENEDNYVMSNLYMYLNFARQRIELPSNRDIIQYIMKSLAYGPRHSQLICLFDLLRFIDSTGDCTCPDSDKYFSYIISHYEPARCMQGIFFYSSTVLSLNDSFDEKEKHKNTINQIKYFIPFVKNCARYFLALSLCERQLGNESEASRLIMKAYVMQPDTDILLNVYNVRDLDQEDYFQKLDRSQELAYETMTHDYEIRNAMNNLLAWRRLYEVNEQIAECEDEEELIDLEKDWNTIISELDMRNWEYFQTHEQKLFSFETRFSSRFKKYLQSSVLSGNFIDCCIQCDQN
jgi:tetratricopeptide (TPR) repeat protein